MEVVSFLTVSSPFEKISLSSFILEICFFPVD